jgi:hypothetical protein
MAVKSFITLAPGWPSVSGAAWIDPDENESVPKLPVIGISSDDAKLVLGQLGGPEAPSGTNVIKLFLSEIYGFSYQATVFVRLDRKSLPMTNTLA